MVDGYLNFNTKINTKGFDKGKKEISNGIGSLKSSLKGLAVAVAAAFSIKAVTSFGKKLIETSAEVRAETAQFTQTFGELGQAADEAMQRVADSSGIVKTRLRSTGTQIYAFAKASGMDAVSAIDMMETSLQVAADSAAYYDRSLEDVSESLRSFLKGNYANDAALGVSATETTRNAKAMQLYGKSFMELSEAQKQLTLLQMVKDANDLSGATGQAAREAEGWENVLGNLKETWRQLLAVVGQPVLRVATIAVQNLTAALDRMLVAAKAVVGTINNLMGFEEDSTAKVADNISSSASSQKALTDSVAKTGKELKKTIAGFDELNVIASETSDTESDSESSSGTSIVTMPTLDTTETENQISLITENIGKILAEKINSALSRIDWDSIEQKVKNGTQKVVDTLNSFIYNIDWNTLGTTLAGGLNTLTGLIDTFYSGTDWSALGAGVAVGLNRAVEKTDWEQLGRAFASPIQAAIDFAYEFVTNFKWKKFGNSIGKALNAALDKIDFKKLGKTLSEGIKGILDAAVGILDTTDFKNIGSKIADLINNIDIVGIVERMATLLSTAVIDLQNLISGLLENTDWGSLVSKVIDSIFAALKAVDWGKLFSATFETMGAAIGALGSIAVALVKKIWELLVDAYNSVKDYFSQKIEECGGNVVAGIFSGIIDAFSSIGKWIKDHIFKPFIDGFKKAFDIHSPSKEMYTMGGYIVDGLFNAVSDGIAKIKEIFTRMLDAIKAVFEKVDEWFEEKFSSAWGKIEAVFTGVGTWFSTKFQEAWDGITYIFSGIGTWFSDRWTDITTAFSDVIGWFGDIFRKAWDGITAIFSWSNVNSAFTKVWTTIKDCFWNVVDWFGDKFQKAYDKITGVFSGIGGFFVGIWKDITNGIVTGINWGIGKINDAIDKLNGFSFKLPSFLGGGKVGFDIPNIPEVPYLAQGTLVPANYGEFLAVLGDNKREAEVVSPLSTIKQAVSEAWKESGNSSKPVVINTYLFPNSRAFHQEVIDITKEESQRSGL